MISIQQNIFRDVEELKDVAPSELFNGDLTHDQVRVMLTLVRRIKTRLEVLDAEMENDI